MLNQKLTISALYFLLALVGCQSSHHDLVEQSKAKHGSILSKEIIVNVIKGGTTVGSINFYINVPDIESGFYQVIEGNITDAKLNGECFVEDGTYKPASLPFGIDSIDKSVVKYLGYDTDGYYFNRRFGHWEFELTPNIYTDLTNRVTINKLDIYIVPRIDGVVISAVLVRLQRGDDGIFAANSDNGDYIKVAGEPIDFNQKLPYRLDVIVP